MDQERRHHLEACQPPGPTPGSRNWTLPWAAPSGDSCVIWDCLTFHAISCLLCGLSSLRKLHTNSQMTTNSPISKKRRKYTIALLVVNQKSNDAFGKPSSVRFLTGQGGGVTLVCSPQGISVPDAGQALGTQPFASQVTANPGRRSDFPRWPGGGSCWGRLCVTLQCPHAPSEAGLYCFPTSFCHVVKIRFSFLKIVFFSFFLLRPCNYVEKVLLPARIATPFRERTVL